MNNTTVVESTITFVKKTLDHAEGGHDWWHIDRVWKLAKKIAATEKVDMFVLKDKVIVRMTLDRTKYGINYNSGNFFEDLGDKLIHDDFDLRMLLFLVGKVVNQL